VVLVIHLLVLVQEILHLQVHHKVITEDWEVMVLTLVEAVALEQ
jgi:hypothetical protein